MSVQKPNIAEIGQKHLTELVPNFLKTPTDKQLAEPAISAIISNAENLLADAHQLMKSGSVKNGLALAVLSFEESGKATFVRWAKFGLAHRDLRKSISSHSDKQKLFQHYLFTINLYKNLFDNSKRETPQQITNMILISAFDERNNILKEGVFHRGNIYNRIKERAFYTDLNSNFDVVSDEGSPEFEREMLMHMISRADLALQMSRSINEIHIFMSFLDEIGQQAKKKYVWKHFAEAKVDLDRLQDMADKINKAGSIKPNS